jgi:hypothetical protein
MIEIIELLSYLAELPKDLNCRPHNILTKLILLYSFNVEMYEI